MLLDQTAFYCITKAQEDRVKRWFNLEEAIWVKDTVTGKSRVRNKPAEENIAELQFNNDLGIQLEIIRYIHGPHWLLERPDFGSDIILSHIGLHLAQTETWPKMAGAQLVQHTVTTHHTAAHYSDPTSAAFGRQYEYKIFEAGPTVHIKYIRRIAA